MHNQTEKNIKILHILQDNKFYYRMLEEIQNKALVTKNMLAVKLYHNDKGLKYIPPYENMEIINPKYNLRKLSKGFDKIVFHRLFWPDVYQLFFFRKGNRIIYWRQWTGDTLLFVKTAYEVKKNRINSSRIKRLDNSKIVKMLPGKIKGEMISCLLWLRNVWRYFAIRRVLEKIDYVGNWNSFERDELKALYPKFNAEYIQLPYEDLEYLKEIDIRRNHQTISVLIGKSGTPNSNHEELIDFFKENYKKNEFKVYCTLSYGDKSYIDSIKRYGKNKLGESFIPIDEYMPPPKYFETLNCFDVFLFNLYSQIGAGTIFSLLYLGKRVFLRDENIMSLYLRTMGVKIYSINELYLNPNLIHVKMDDQETRLNITIMKEYFNKKKFEESIKNIIM